MKKRSPNGFTLIELLVATGVTVIIVGLMITMVSNLLSAYNRSSGALAAQNQAGLALEQMTTEIESLVLRNSPDVMLAAEVRTSWNNTEPSLPSFEWDQSDKPDDSNSLEIASVTSPDERFDFQIIPPIETQRFGQGGVWLRYFSAAPSLKESRSGVRAIGYAIGLDGVTDADDAPIQYMLYRVEVPVQETFENGYDLGNSGNPTVTFLANPGEDELFASIIASNVVDFGVRFFEISEDPDTLRQRGILFPLGTTPGQLEYEAAGSNGDEYPDVIEVMLRVITPEGERLLAALRDGQISPPDELTEAQFWWEIVEQNSEIFTRVIKVNASAL